MALHSVDSPYKRAYQHLYIFTIHTILIHALVNRKTFIYFRANGPDPLDYISIYRNKGNSSGVPPHWHYISCGLSDLYGDGRLHE